MNAQLGRTPEPVLDERRVSIGILVLAPMRHPEVHAAPQHPFDRDRDPGPAIMARWRLAVEPIRYRLIARPLSPSPVGLRDERCRLIGDEPLAVVLAIAVRQSRRDMHAAADRVREARLPGLL